ncbi:MAG: LCP family protein [Clostridia bacterium]|nr:LCP family protein [Clostridia bacterium]
MTGNSEKFTKRDSKADTADIPAIHASGADNKDYIDERSRRALSYRERQRLEAERNGRAPSGAIRPPLQAQRAVYKPQPSRNAEPSQPSVAPPTKKRNAAKPPKRRSSTAYRVACGILGTLIGLVIVLSGIAAWYIYSADYKQVENLHPDDSNAPTEIVDTDNGPETRVNVPVYEGEQQYGVRDAIRYWKNQGTAYLQSNKVINILLAGIDRNEDGSDGRSDTMIVASINLKTKTIILSSLYRDCWVYTTYGEDSSAWGKLNETLVYGHGDPKWLVANIEDYYKIHIDHFVGVDFQSFKDIVDAIGGVTLSVKQYEAEYINEQLGYDGCPYGDSVTLQGDAALWYVRIRHSDQDEEISRTRRQRQFITALIDQFKSTAASKLPGLVNSLIGYVQTDLSKTEIIEYGTKALFQRWYNYEIRQQQVPADEYRREYWNDDYFEGKWVWLVDFPGAAKAMQEEIYGYSNIVLNDDRYDIVRMSWNTLPASK